MGETASGLSGRSRLEWTQWTATERVVLADPTLSTQSTTSTKSTFNYSPTRRFADAGLRSFRHMA